MKNIKNVIALMLLLLLSACAQLPDNPRSQYSSALPVKAGSPLTHKIKPLLNKHPRQSAFNLLGDNLDAFAVRMELIQRAQNSIDAQYYILENDITGKLFLYALLQAADRGVRVRLLLDDLNTDGRDQLFATLDQHPYFSVKTFNPFNNRKLPWVSFLQDFDRLDRRMHNKSLTIDNLVTIVGGRNIGDVYFSLDPNRAFGDLDLLGIGPVSQQVSASFDRYWNDPYSYSYRLLTKGKPTQQLPAIRQNLQRLHTAQQFGEFLNHSRHAQLFPALLNGSLPLYWAQANVYADDPRQTRSPRNDLQYSISPQIRQIATQSQRDVLLFSPYFIPRFWGIPTFRQLKQRGLSTRILTNSLASTDVSAVHSGYIKYRKPLLRLGVELYEFKPGKARTPRNTGTSSLHAKSFIFDRKKLFVGSLNLDPRSTVLNTEMGILVHSPALATQLADWFEQNVEQIAYQLKLTKDRNGREHLLWLDHTPSGTVYYTKEPHSKLLKRVGIRLLSLLPIEGEL